MNLAKRNLLEQDLKLFSENILILDEIIDSPNHLFHFINGALAVSKPDFFVIDTYGFIEISKELRNLAILLYGLWHIEHIFVIYFWLTIALFN